MVGQCALADHYRQTEHTIDFQNTSIVDHERNWRKRHILEALHILTDNKPRNYRNDTNGISRTYAGIVTRKREDNKARTQHTNTATRTSDI